MTKASDYALCATCKRPRLKPPGGLYSTNDVACEVCGDGYSILPGPITDDQLAEALHSERCTPIFFEADEWVCARVAELRGQGEKARVIVQWRTRSSGMKSMEILIAVRRENGRIERPPL